MSVVIPHRAINTVTASNDPRKAIQTIVGDLSGFELIGDRVLVGIFMRPEKTKGGIIRPDMNKEEDVWQGKVGLVLKSGPDAFKNPETGELYEQAFNPGDWCVFFVGDGRAMQVKDMPCRIVKDTSLIAKIEDPMSVL
jgi:co-chaperonin GroES (HSP10)